MEDSHQGTKQPPEIGESADCCADESVALSRQHVDGKKVLGSQLFVADGK